jgi:transcriptional regulator with XRE-family HTH domain
MFETWAEGVTDRREQLSELLTEERKSRKIRQQQLAHKLGQPQSRISRIENGEYHIDVGEFLALADAIGFDPGIALRKIQGAAHNDCSLDEALAIVKAAGYRVTKPRTKPKSPEHKTRVGPTCVIEFDDGVVTRMSTWCASDEKLDWDRGVRLAQAAYQSRTRRSPPAIIAARFERDGQVLARRNGGEMS